MLTIAITKADAGRRLVVVGPGRRTTSHDALTLVNWR